MSVSRNVLHRNPILRSDSYKYSHQGETLGDSAQYPPGTDGFFHYLEARDGDVPECTLFGLQAFAHEVLLEPITHAHVDEAKKFLAAHGEPFNEPAYRRIVDRHGGYWPVLLRAVPEGTVAPLRTAMLTVESTDALIPWAGPAIENQLVRLWAPSTVAIMGRQDVKMFRWFSEISADEPEKLLRFKKHCFGSRGCMTHEQAEICGAAHTLNFWGSDTVEGVRYANHYYRSPMSAFSIVASEHGTVTPWGKEHEYDMFGAYVDRYVVSTQQKPHPIAACVSDSYDIFEAVKAWTGETLLPKIESSGGTLVIRPDSGNPLVVWPKIFDILGERLGSRVTENRKGYRLLPTYFSSIWGDGMDSDGMRAATQALVSRGWSIDNFCFGSGGANLQKWNRDTQGWAMKCSAASVFGKWRDVYKEPLHSKTKASKRGRLDTIQTNRGLETVVVGDQDQHPDTAMVRVYENGELFTNWTLESCRERIAA